MDAVLGTASYEDIAEAIEEALGGQTMPMIMDPLDVPVHTGKRMLTTGGHYAYLKIAEGCDKHCTYCIIPKVRGAYRSVPMEELIDGGERAGRAGGEGADSGGPGDDPVRRGSLWRKRAAMSCCRSCASIDRHPLDPDPVLLSGGDLPRSSFEVMKEEEKICHYLDLPDPACRPIGILRRMGQKDDRKPSCWR